MFLDQQKQRERQSINGLQNAFKAAYHLQNEPHLQEIIRLNNLYLLQNIQQLNKQIPNPSPVALQQYMVFKLRCEKVMNSNQKLKQTILLIKNKLQKQLSFGDSLESVSTVEEVQITEKIKRLSTQIRGKILQVKEKKYLDRQTAAKNQPNLSQRQSKQRMQPLSVPLEQMKKGTEFMFRNLIGLKYDIEVTEKYLKTSSELISKPQPNPSHF